MDLKKTSMIKGIDSLCRVKYLSLPSEGGQLVAWRPEVFNNQHIHHGQFNALYFIA